MPASPSPTLLPNCQGSVEKVAEQVLSSICLIMGWDTHSALFPELGKRGGVADTSTASQVPVVRGIYVNLTSFHENDT